MLVMLIETICMARKLSAEHGVQLDANAELRGTRGARARAAAAGLEEGRALWRLEEGHALWPPPAALAHAR